MGKKARRSVGKEYDCQQDWPEKCFVQCGGSGVVFSKKGNYTTAFFEAFPRNPDCFMRGEGETVEAAEQDCFNRYQKVLNCKGHEFEARGRKDGYGYCIHCPLSQSQVLPMGFECVVCGIACHGHTDVDGNEYCREHYHELDFTQAKKETMSLMYGSVESRKFRFLFEGARIRKFKERGLPIEDSIKEASNLESTFTSIRSWYENNWAAKKKMTLRQKLGLKGEELAEMNGYLLSILDEMIDKTIEKREKECNNS